MAGVHIAEARKIPYFRAFTMPWTRTQAYPQAFMVPAFEMGPSFNYSTYVLFDNIIWKATAGQINRWRKTQLNLKSTDMSTLQLPAIGTWKTATRSGVHPRTSNDSWPRRKRMAKPWFTL
jgi:sterol 3beta-glucosyltransferase